MSGLMRNRAKCKLCGDILESFHRYDMVICKCGEISIEGGMDHYQAFAKNWDNFLRVDDKGIEISIKVVEKDKIEEQPIEEESKPLQKSEMLEMLDIMIKTFENLPKAALHQPITHADHLSLMMLLSSILRAS